MVLSLFKKKEVVDLREKDSDMPIPAKLRERLIGKSDIKIEQETKKDSSSSGGFFNFFGNNTATETPSSNTEHKSFWDIGTNTNESAQNSTTQTTDSQINDIIYKLSRITDRLELVEKKIERIERRMGQTENSY